MENKILKYYYNLKEIIRENGFEVNFLIFISIFTFVIIGIDLDSDLAVQKNEIDSVVATLTDSINTLYLDATNVLIIEPPLLGVISSYNEILKTTFVIDFPRGRSPPLSNSHILLINC